MYLQAANSIEDVITFGVKPAIELLNIIEDLEANDTDDRAEMLHVEIKGRLFRIKERLEVIDRAQRNQDQRV